jgi:hypothetical protein
LVVPDTHTHCALEELPVCRVRVLVGQAVQLVVLVELA